MRLFLAVWPPEAVVARLQELPRAERRGVRWTGAEQWHVTLRFLGSVSDADADAAVAALAGLDVAGPVTAVMGPQVSLLGRGVLCLPVAGLDGLAAAVRAATAGVGERGEEEGERSFRGHLTLARGRAGVDLRPLSGVPFTARWEVDETTLVASDTRPEGARYRVVARRPILAPEG